MIELVASNKVRREVHYSFLFLLLFFVGNIIKAQSYVQALSYNQRVQVIAKGKKIETNSEVYFNVANETLITVQHSPDEVVFFTNSKGELRIYWPTRNEISLRHLDFFSTNSVFISSFVAKDTWAFGLRDLGFVVQSTRTSGTTEITTWLQTKPVEMVTRVDMFHKAGVLQGYIYFDRKTIVKKTFYADYKPIGNVLVPCRITDISYQANGDSVVSLTALSALVCGAQAKSKYLGFKIPNSAKRVE